MPSRKSYHQEGRRGQIKGDVQQGRQIGQHTGKQAWKSNQKQIDRQPGEGQRPNQNTAGSRQRSNKQQPK